jgi:alginate O-acetyltransferase complex protein AlgI
VSFVSYAFLVLFLVVLACRLTFGRRKVEFPFVVVLIASSALFYAWHVPAYISILLFSTAVDYVAGRALRRMDPADPRLRPLRRAWLAGSLGVNLSLLAAFKYADFAAGNLNAWLGPGAAPVLGLTLPMGISFYTFQSMSYTIDVYRGKVPALTSFWPFFLYVSFFPQLVAGPIVRASEFLPQMSRPREPRLRVWGEGLYLLTSGFFLKMVCADNLAVYVDRHWAEGYQAGADSGLLVGLALLFSGQIFADFAGYSNIARGSAYLLGYRLPINFDAPYIAGSFKNFWERWHITLSRWLRDYLYVALGGNRRGRARTYLNLLAVMLLGGLWHGAAWTFVLWGALHGASLAVERALALHATPGRRWIGGLWFLVVQAVVLVAWIPFRSESFEGARQFLANIAAGAFEGGHQPIAAGFLFLAPLFVLHGWTALVERGAVRPLSPAWRGVLAGAMAAALLMTYGGSSAFIYFQF